MQLTFLGTSAGSPTRDRNVTSMALRLDNGRVWLFDCGEGTQHQILKCDIKPTKIDKIFITHFHGDHWYGLPGLISSLKIHGRTEPIEVYAPPGLEQVMSSIYQLSDSRFPFSINYFVTSHLEESWVMENKFKVRACPIVHSIPCFAYIVEQPDLPGSFLIDDLRRQGIDDINVVHKLANGEDAKVGDLVLKSQDFRGESRRGKKIVLLGDTCDASSISDYCYAPDWITHEATYDRSLEEKALQFKHATAAMAGSLAHRLEARNLILTHFSGRYHSDSEIQIKDLVDEAARQAPKTQVWAAEDFKTFDL